MEAQARQLLAAISAHAPALEAWPEVKALREALDAAGGHAGLTKGKQALALVESEGITPLEASRRVGCQPSVVYRALKRATEALGPREISPAVPAP